MFNFLHRGIVANVKFNEITVEEEGIDGAYAKSLSAGKAVALGDGGLVPAGGKKFLGFLVEGVQNTPYQNSSALASGLLPVTIGNCIGESDAIAEGITFTEGDPIYVDATTSLLTNEAGTESANGTAIGIAGATTSAESPAVQVIVV